MTQGNGGPDRGSRDDIMAAGMPDSRKGIHLCQDGDRRAPSPKDARKAVARPAIPLSSRNPSRSRMPVQERRALILLRPVSGKRYNFVGNGGHFTPFA